MEATGNRPDIWLYLDAAITHAIAAAEAGKLDGLVVSMPPQHGKSELCSKYLPAWYLGTHPDRRVILTSYEADFAASWGRKARDLLEAWGWLFGVRVSRRSSAARRWDLEDREGGMTTAGVGGPITGKGAHLLIVDDPVKNDEEARSRHLPPETVGMVADRWPRPDFGPGALDCRHPDPLASGRPHGPDPASRPPRRASTGGS